MKKCWKLSAVLITALSLSGCRAGAGSCLLSAFRYEGRTLIIGVFGCPEAEDRFADTLQLFNEIIGVK